MKRTHFLFTAALLLIAAAAAGAQGTLSLGPSKVAPKVDGVIADKEYTASTTVGTLQVSLAWTADALYVGVTGQTTGWVAVGLGSPAMDKAVMYIGYVSGDASQLKVQLGAGHSHADTVGNVPVAYALKEANGQTSLELSLKPAAFIAQGQKKLDLIMAMGGSDSFVSLHRARARASVVLAQ